MSNKILFLNLDGTCRRAKSGATFINDPMVSDRPKDQQCAANANVPFIWAKEWRDGR